MPLYMFEFRYTSEAWASLEKHPEDRRSAVKKLMEELGCKLVEIYYALGEYDGLVIYEAPNRIKALAVSLNIARASHIGTTKTTSLYTVEEAMEAMGFAGRFTLDWISEVSKAILYPWK